MSFADVLKSSFLERYSVNEYSVSQIALVFLITGIIGVYIFFCYRFLTRRTFYSRNFNISLVAMAVITAAIILTIQSSIVVSLGMVGALSIVRFRTAIKDPMDLVFLFWSISTGIICGAGLFEIALIVAVAVTILVFALNKMPNVKAPKILVINIDNADDVSEKLETIIKAHTFAYTEKTRRLSGGSLNLIYELRIKDSASLVNEINKVSGIRSVSLLSHDGEVTF